MTSQNAQQLLDSIVDRVVTLPRSDVESQLRDSVRSSLASISDGEVQAASATVSWTRLQRIAIIAMAICVGFVVFFSAIDRSGMALGEVLDAMSRVQNLQLRIDGNRKNPGNVVTVWYSHGRGFCLRGPGGSQWDNGVSYWKYFRKENVAVKSRSRLGDSSFSSAAELGRLMGFFIEDVREQLPRLPEADRIINDMRCEAYIWTRSAPEDPLPAQGRTIFLLDDKRRLQRCEYQRKLKGIWQTTRTVELSYDKPIADARFKPDFGKDVKVINASVVNAKQVLPVDVAVAALSKGVVEQHAKYYGLSFEYTVKTTVKEAPANNADNQFKSPGVTDGLLVAHDTFSILPPSKPNGRPWRLWIRRVKDKQGQWSLNHYAVYDGKRTHLCIRDNRGRQVKRVVEFEDTTQFYLNVFDSILFTLLNGVVNVEPMTDDLKRLHLDRFYVVNREISEGTELLGLYGSSSADFGMEYRVTMSGKPDYLVMRREALDAKRNSQVLASYKLNKIGRISGIAYPAKGSWRQAGIGFMNQVEYEFEVTAVRVIGEKERRMWVSSPVSIGSE